MSDAALVAIYRACQRLYPRAFRDEFSDDMVSMFREQLRDEPTTRVCARSVVDLVVTIPTQHVEVHMSRNRTPAIVLCIALPIAAAGFVLVDGLLGLVIALLGAALSILIWRHERPAPSQRGSARRWWVFLTSGVLLFAAVVIVTTATGELSEPAWAVAASAFLVAVCLLGSGMVLGIVRFTDRRTDITA